MKRSYVRLIATAVVAAMLLPLVGGNTVEGGMILNNHKILAMLAATGDPNALNARKAAVEATGFVTEAFTQLLKAAHYYDQAELAKFEGDDVKLRMLHQKAITGVQASLEAISNAVESYKKHQALWQKTYREYQEGLLSPKAQEAFEAFVKAAEEIGWNIEADFAGYFDYMGRLTVMTSDLLDSLKVTPPCFPFPSEERERLEKQWRDTFKEWIQALSFIERTSALSSEAARMALKRLGF